MKKIEKIHIRVKKLTSTSDYTFHIYQEPSHQRFLHNGLPVYCIKEIDLGFECGGTG